MKALTKEQEIELLKKLVEGNGYFSQLIDQCNLEIMINNIHNDFAIENGTIIESEVSRLTNLLDAQKEMHRKEIDELLAKQNQVNMQFASDLLLLSDENVDNLVRARLGMDKTIKLKKQLGILISEEEIDYLISKI